MDLEEDQHDTIKRNSLERHSVGKGSVERNSIERSEIKGNARQQQRNMIDFHRTKD